jgi:polyisoprenyl-phosphate glycosyltransferase
MVEPIIWIVCPTYSDVESFIQLRAEVRKILKGACLKIKFAVIDDTAGLDREILELEHFDDVKVITCPFNLGHQRAIVFGLRQLKTFVKPGDTIVTMDSDGEDMPKDIPRLLEALQKSNESFRSLVLAQRTRRRESLLFKVCYFFFKSFFRVLTGQIIRTGNYACFRGSLLTDGISHPNFDLCYSSSLVRLKLPIIEVPCARGVRYAGQSRMNFSSLIMHGIRMLMPFLDKIATRALIGFASTFAASLVLALVVVGVRLFTDLAIPGWATFTLLLLITLSFIALGNFLIIFAVFSQSQSIALSKLDQHHATDSRKTFKQAA